MKVAVFAFQPKEGATTRVANSATATPGVALPYDCDTVVLTNSSTTATVFVRVTQFLDSTLPADAAANAPTVTTDMPILPNSQIRRAVGEGNKMIRTIASSADGFIYITPGTGV